VTSYPFMVRTSRPQVERRDGQASPPYLEVAAAKSQALRPRRRPARGRSCWEAAGVYTRKRAAGKLAARTFCRKF
jgi:hypothetical protein